MKNFAKTLSETMEPKIRPGSIIEAGFANFDPVRTIALVKQQNEEGNYQVEYPDGEYGELILASPIPLTNDRYAEYVEDLKVEAQKRSDIDWRLIVERINRWIRTQNKHSVGKQMHSAKVPAVGDET